MQALKKRKRETEREREVSVYRTTFEMEIKQNIIKARFKAYWLKSSWQ